MATSYTESDLIEKANQAIGELVYEKTDLQKAYNYYHGRRDKEQFRYLEENFGIGNATSVQFTPLIKKHVDELIGEYLGTPIIPQVTCKDKDTINNMLREKELEISRTVYKTLQQRLQNRLLDFIQTKDNQKLVDPSIQEQLQAIIEDLNVNYVSKYEIAAKNIVQYVLQSRQTDMPTKLRQMFLDVLVGGQAYYQVGQTPSGNNISIECLNPLDVFPDKNYNSPYVKDSYRIVVRRWMTPTEIFNRYGNKLTKDDKDLIKSSIGDRNSTSKYVRAVRTVGKSDGIVADTEVRTGGSEGKKEYYNMQLIPVYEVQWTETDSDYVMQRYSVVRIGDQVFIVNGKDEHVQRSISNPSYCALTVNGVFFDNRTDEPFSLVKSCMHLQDKYDLLIFYRDNILANSGTVGDWIDEALIPSNLGANWAERLQKWLAYKKQGIGLLNTAEEGRIASGQAQLNTIFNGFDDTVKTQAVQAIQLAIDSIEQTMSSISGVFRERLNGIEARDAVTNVRIGQNNSFIVTKHWFQQMELTVEELLTDVLNKAKIVYKKGLTGTLILGEKQQQIFTALPEYFTNSDIDVHVLASSDIIKDTTQLQQLVPEFIKMNAVTPDIILDVLDTKSLTEAKLRLREAIKKQREENNQLQQLQQQLQEAQQKLQQADQQMKDLSKQNEKLSKDLESLNRNKLDLERQKIEDDSKIRWFEAQTDRTFKENKAQNEDDRTKIEQAQMYDRNPFNDKIRDL